MPPITNAVVLLLPLCFLDGNQLASLPSEIGLLTGLQELLLCKFGEKRNSAISLFVDRVKLTAFLSVRYHPFTACS